MKYRIVFAFLLASFITPVSVAQQTATVKSVVLTTDHIPVAERRKDLNGTFCALVKVQVVDDIERVEGNKIGDIVDRGVEKWIYMCKGSRNIKINLKNHLPLKIMFRDYDIKGLESNRVYEIVIDANTPLQVVNENEKINKFMMKVSPKNAAIVIWGENMSKRLEHPQSDGTLEMSLPYGRYHFWAEANGYHRKDSSVFVNDEIQVLTVRLSPVLSDVTITCPTSKAEFFINGVKMARNKKGKSCVGQLPSGQYIIEARAKGYSSQLRRIYVSPQSKSEVVFDELLSVRKQKLDSAEEELKALRDSIMRERETNLARIEKAKADSIAKENSYDIIQMKDGSTVWCRVSDVRDNMLLVRQKGNDNVQRIPIREIIYIDYLNGEHENFNTN